MSTPAEESSIRWRERRSRSALKSWRLLLILPLLATAIFLTLLGFVNQRTEAEIRLTANRVSFVVGDATELLSSVAASTLSLQGFETLELGPGRLAVAAFDAESADLGGCASFEADRPIRVSARDDFASVTLEGVTLDELTIPSGSSVSLAWDEDDPGVVSFDLDARAVGRTVIPETLRLDCDYCSVPGLPAVCDVDPKRLTFTGRRKRPISVTGGRDRLAMALEVPPGTRLAEGNLTLADDLKLRRLVGGTLSSTLIGAGGTITFDELGGKQVEVDAGDFLLLDDFDVLRVKSLAIDDGIRMVLHGRPGVLASGPKGFIKNRLPTRLEWVAARETWVLWANGLFVATTSVLAGLRRVLLGKRR